LNLENLNLCENVINRWNTFLKFIQESNHLIIGIKFYNYSIQIHVSIIPQIQIIFNSIERNSNLLISAYFKHFTQSYERCWEVMTFWKFSIKLTINDINCMHYNQKFSALLIYF
jgi:hypothetical protein